MEQHVLSVCEALGSILRTREKKVLNKSRNEPPCHGRKASCGRPQSTSDPNRQVKSSGKLSSGRNLTLGGAL